MNRKNGCNSSVRIGNIPAAATIGGGCSAKNKHTASIMCLVALSSLTAAFAFCPGEFGRAGRSVDLSSIRMHGGLSKICRQSRRLPSALFSSDDDEVNDAISRINKEETTEALPVGDESLEDEDEEIEDIVLQKLHRSAQRGPINPMKEHDKMLQENEDEFLNVTSSGDADTEGEEELHKSTFYRQLVASYIDPYMDVHGSQDETYVDEQMYEMLSRDGEVLEKFGPGLSTMPLDPTSEEGKVEDDLAQKERSLQNIVKQIDAGEGKWDKAKIDEAARLKDQIDKMHIDDFGNVLLANLAFYEAFSARDADWMKDVWWQSPSTICVHPSHEPLVGSKAVLENFRQMFDREMMSREKSRDRIVDTLPAPSVFMSPANIRGLSVRGTTASLVCDEEVIDRDSYSNGRVVVNKLLATNVFRKIGGKWKMVHRHASWHPETLAADAAIKAKPGFAPVKTKRAKFSDSLEEKRMRIKKLGGGGSTSIRPQDAQPSPRSLDGLNANNAVGIPDVKMPKKKKKKPSEEENLLRMLGISAGSNDDVDDDDDNDDDQDESSSNPRTKKFSLSDLLRSAGDGKTTRTGSGTPEDPFITRRVITIGPEEFNKLAAEGDKINEEGDEDSDEDDEDSDDDDENSVGKLNTHQLNYF